MAAFLNELLAGWNVSLLGTELCQGESCNIRQKAHVTPRIFEAFDVTYSSEEQKSEYVWATSWGVASSKS